MKDKRQDWLLVKLAVLAMVCAMWLLSLEGAHATPCPDGKYWYCGACYTPEELNRRFPPGGSCTPIAPDPTTDDEEPTYTATVASTATPTPTATNTRRPAVPAEEEPAWTTTPTAPAPPAATARPTLTPVAATMARKAVDLPCLPKHAGRPVALCESGSGSGWWLYYIGAGGRIESGPHVPYPSAELAGKRAVLRHYISGAPIELRWSAESVQVRTAYGGKAYHFAIDADGGVRHIAW
ncbi:MAG: hypothetical protein OXO50_13675 [Caldilineaceae bacterium]|nr:hypothetical protein [Caldilineaceae bacterium]MDE0196723.1 hypothetical protein [Caldilineaceae bacterium]